MPPLVVDPAALDGAGAAAISAGDALAAAIGAVTLRFGANTGQDPAGGLFGLAYQDAAKDALTAAAAAVNACRRIGYLIEASAVNYSMAEAASTLGGGAPLLPAPTKPGVFNAPGAPWTLGPGVDEPILWTVVESFVGSVWPNGDPAELHAAAGSWQTLAAAFNSVNQLLAQPESVIDEQLIPENGQMHSALAEIGANSTKIVAKCGMLGEELDGFADEVQHAQDAIRNLLHRLGSPSGWWHEVVAVFEGDGLKEVKKIGDDINAVLHNMKREADARRQAMQLGMNFMDSAVVALQAWARTELTQFLGNDVGNPVATAFDTFTNLEEGILKDAVGIEQGFEQMTEPKLLLDPQGGVNDAKDLLKTGALWYLVNPREAAEADKAIVKQLLHLDDWRRDRPGLGAGENLLDIASLFIPGAGEAGAGVEGAEGAAAAGKAAEAADDASAAGRGLTEVGDLGRATRAMNGIGETSGDITRSFNGIGRDLAKNDHPAPGGRPAALPPAKPGEPPVGAPRGPVEPKPPTEPPASAPSEVGEQPPARAAADPHGAGSLTGERGFSVAPQNHLPAPHPTPARVPTSLGRAPIDPPFPASAPHTLPRAEAAPEPQLPHGGSDHHGVSDGAGPHEWHSPGDDYTPSDVAMEAAERTRERAVAAEKGISPGVVDAVSDTEGHLERWDSRIKEIDSLARKLDDKLRYVDPSEVQEIHAVETQVNDAVRYTVVASEKGYWSHGDAVIKAMEQRGFTLAKDSGAWNGPNVYRGRNLTFQTPDGYNFEVQIHTRESLRAAERTHWMYEELRLRTTSAERRAELLTLQAEIFNRVPIPEGTPIRWKQP